MQDFIVRYGLQSLPRIAEVSSIGGYVKTYQVILDPKKLEQYDIGIMEMMESLKEANNNVSGKVVDTGGREVAIKVSDFFKGPLTLQTPSLGRRPMACLSLWKKSARYASQDSSAAPSLQTQRKRKSGHRRHALRGESA